MKIIFSEHNKDYSSYTFDYAVYAVMEEKNELPEIYGRGFLPYSNDLSDPTEAFYMARSLRVELVNFTDSSENRRVNRKLEHLQLNPEVIPKEAFDLSDPNFRKLCLDYAQDRFSGNAMTDERFDYILKRKVLSHIIQFSDVKGQTVGYVFALIEGNTFHYWYAYFDQHLLDTLPVGKWMMWRSIKLAAESGLDYVYLGTCYGEKSLYKVRDFKSLTFFDGQNWNQDMKLLKRWCKADHEPLPVDRYKLK